MTDGVDAIDTGLGLWLSVSEIARQRGVSKQAVAKKVERLGLETRPGPAGTKLVSIAAFDMASSTHTDAVRTANGIAALPALSNASSDPVLAREQARRTAYQADIAKLDFEERVGKLLPLDEVVIGLERVAASFVRVLEQIPSRADDIVSALAKDGAPGVRSMLKEVVYDVRMHLEREMAVLERDIRPNPKTDGAPVTV